MNPALNGTVYTCNASSADRKSGGSRSVVVTVRGLSLFQDKIKGIATCAIVTVFNVML